MRTPPLPGAGNLPRPRTSFIGRDNELAEARQLLEHARLMTLTGAGGCGKTRFAIALANAVADDFPAGVHFVSLAAIQDPALVPVSIAQSIGLQDSRGRPLLEHLSRYVADGKLLLVLDNFEHLLSAGEFVGQLLDASTFLRVVVTSRSPLHLSGEQEFPVPPLAVPRLGSHLSTAAVAGCEAAQLFAERAAASVPGFAIDDTKAAAILSGCGPPTVIISITRCHTVRYAIEVNRRYGSGTPSHDRFQFYTLDDRCPRQAEVSAGATLSKRPCQGHVQASCRAQQTVKKPQEGMPSYRSLGVNSLVNGTSVGLSGLEPLTSALSGEGSCDCPAAAEASAASGEVRFDPWSGRAVVKQNDKQSARS